MRGILAQGIYNAHYAHLKESRFYLLMEKFI